jgi:hypothetical protein
MANGTRSGYDLKRYKILRSPMPTLPVVNTHVHVAPNFSAFDTVAEVVAAAQAQGVRALGISSFFDQQVYGRFADACAAADIVPLFGLEFITADADLAARGVRVNDPANPGRIYFCGKGIQPFRPKSDAAAATHASIREANDTRARAMVSQLADHFAAHGVPTGLTSDAVAAAVAARGDVPVEWVSLQERHIARAFADAIAALPASERAAALERVLGVPAKDPEDAVGVQGEIRARLLKSGTPGFVPEAPISFGEVYDYVLAVGGIPTYPILGDGAGTITEWEDPATLAQRLRDLGVHAAELIPARNASAVADAYVAALTAVGVIVMGGTEHNTLDRIPLDPACADGPISDAARAAFFEATCVVAAHQHLVAQGAPGYVDAAGALVGDASHRTALVELGASIIGR